jgi:hypothetical protein
MAAFKPNQPISTDRPFVVVDAGLQPGRYRFRLVVIDTAGNASLPSEQIITILEPRSLVGPRTPVGPLAAAPVLGDAAAVAAPQPPPPLQPPSQPAQDRSPPWWLRWRR